METNCKSTDRVLAVAEQFYSIQGEGQTIGIPAYFLRLAGCNLMCGGAGTEKDGQLHNGATWRCDSIEVWRKGKRKTFAQIYEDWGGNEFFRNLKNGAHVVITGGEPLMHQAKVEEFISSIEYIMRRPIIFEIETNGTIMPSVFLMRKVSFWNVSPKLSNSGEPHEKRINVPALMNLLHEVAGKTILKWVISDVADLVQAQNIMQDLNVKDNQVYLMPAGSTQEELALTAPLVADLAKINCYRYSHRVHVAIWNLKVGV